MMPYDLSETPGAFYAIGYWMSCVLFIAVNKKRFKGLKLYVVCCLFLAALFLYMEVFNSDVSMVMFIPSMILTITIMFGFIAAISDFSVLNIGYYTARAFILGEFTASLAYQIYYYSVLNLDLPFTYISTYSFIFFSYSLIFIIIYFMEERYIDENFRHVVTHRELLSASIIAVAIFMMSNISYIYQNTPFSGDVAGDIFNVRTLIDFAGVALLFAYHMQINELNMKFEVESLQKLLNLQIANYEMSEKSIEMVNKKYHDLKHMIMVMKSGDVSEELYESLTQMEEEIKIYEAQNKTGNKILDTILMGKQLYCQSDGINLTSIAEGEAIAFMDPIDISTLFGNILDNAIESVKKLKDTERRLIHLVIAKQKGFVRIKVENCYDGVLDYNDKLPVTTKKDKVNHGYGLKSIGETVRKYGGSMTIDAQNGWFEIRILIPINGT